MPLSYLRIYLFMYLFIIYLFIYLLIYLFIYFLFIYLFIYFIVIYLFTFLFYYYYFIIFYYCYYYLNIYLLSNCRCFRWSVRGRRRPDYRERLPLRHTERQQRQDGPERDETLLRHTTPACEKQLHRLQER